MLAQSLSLDVFAVAAGAVMGAGIAVHRRFDIMGIIGLAVISGVGGSLLRDLLLQDGIPRALQDWRYGVAVLVGGLLGSFFAGAAQRALPVLLLIDSVALGLFAAIGARASLDLGLPEISAVAVGTVAATGGWVIRDLVTGVIPPDLFKPGDLHGAAALIGCTVYVGLVTVGVTNVVAGTICVLVTFVVRWSALRYHLRTPTAHDYSPTWAQPSSEQGPS